MRPFVWGGLLLLVIVAFLSTTHVSFGPPKPPMPPVPPMPPMAPVSPRIAVAEEHVMVSGTTRVSRSVVAPGTARKVKTTRGVDPETVLHSWTVQGDYRENLKEALESAVDTARNDLTHMLRLTVPPPREVVREKLVKKETPEKNDELVVGTPHMRVALDLVLTRGTYLELAEAERAVRITNRMEGSARLLAIVVVALAALAGYIRLDEFTKGYYTGRLRLVTVVVIAAATVFLGRVNL